MYDRAIDIPEWVIIPTSELGRDRNIGHVIEAWRGNIKVEFYGKDDQVHLAIHTVLSNQIQVPSLTDWIEYATWLGDFN